MNAFNFMRKPMLERKNCKAFQYYMCVFITKINMDKYMHNFWKIKFHFI